MLERVRSLQRRRKLRLDGGGGVLVKMPKAAQDTRIDLPAIGPRTIEKLRRQVSGRRGRCTEWSSSSAVRRADGGRMGTFRDGRSDMSQAGPPLNVAIVVGEHSGDQLGFKLMRALGIAAGDRHVRFIGVGGEAMEAEGLRSIFPLHDISVMGILPVIARLPTILARIRQTVAAIVESRPDVLVIIDSPDFTHRVARGVRKSLPDFPSSTMSAPASGHGVRGGQGRCALMSITCWHCCLSSLPHTSVWRPSMYLRWAPADRTAEMSCGHPRPKPIVATAIRRSSSFCRAAGDQKSAV